MRDKLKRCISIILCVAMIVTSLPFIPGVFALDNNGMDPVTTTENIVKDGITYTITRKLQYAGNRYYSMQVDISSDMSSFEHARVRTSAKNGYLTIPQTGYYLIELWGGDGADGWSGLTGAIIIPLPTEGGDGASGGYVYGKVYLKKGQTLVYNIGTNGTQSAEHNDGAGGVNGGGGTHGEEGSYVVGGGGGYTAVYLFNEGEFNENYVTESTLSIPETARLSRYIMIAGGGGGGGAGIGGSLPTLADNGSPPSAPDGGAGGSVNRGGEIALLGSDYDVPGYVFPGRNGLSSGTDTRWIGIGGTNVPGPGSVTVGGQFTETTSANDWTGTHATYVTCINDDCGVKVKIGPEICPECETILPVIQPGAGGSGNFRGGGGGSGYTGGSGGLMKGQVLASHVGGGGGGASFVAAEVNGQPILYEGLDSNTTKYISGANNQTVGAETGGACQITYLGEQDEKLYEDNLKDVTLNATLSKYFEVTKVTSTGPEEQITINGTDISIGGLSILPSSPAHAGERARVNFTFKAKEDFMGGNAVEMLENLQLNFLSPNDNTTSVTVKPEENHALDTVNVPLKAKNVRTKSYTTSVAGKSYTVSSLYADDYAGVRDNLRESWAYDYVEAISDYQIYKGDTEITSSTVTAPTTAGIKNEYLIQYTVTFTNAPDEAIKVGPSMGKDTVISGTSIISLVQKNTVEWNELLITGEKNLNYQDGVYDFSVNVSQESKPTALETSSMSTSSVGEGTFEAPCDGWYYLQAWGGNGGSSGSASCTGYNGNDTRDAAGASGGQGGYVTGYVYLKQGQVITYNVGNVGTSITGTKTSKSNSYWNYNTVIKTDPGYGGKSTKIYLNGAPLIIAGGGGGGGGSVLAFSQYVGPVYSRPSDSYPTTGIGKTPSQNSSISTTLSSSESSYDGGTGGYGTGSAKNISVSATGGSGGAAGSNYRMSGLSSGYDSTGTGITLPVAAEKYASQQSTSKSGKTGKIAITLVSNDESQGNYDAILGIRTKVAISRYFDVTGLNLKTGDSYTKTNVVDNGDNSKTVSYLNSNSEVIAKFTYRIDDAKDGVSQVVSITDLEYIPDPYTKTENGINYLYYKSTIDFTYSLKPKEGFLGGNNVPVLSYGQVGDGVDSEGYADYGVRVLQGDSALNLQPNDMTDFANVEYEPNLDKYLSVTDKTIKRGQTVEKTELYEYTVPTYAEDAWEDDYAYFVAPDNETYAPLVTKDDCAIEVAYTPRYVGNAVKANIVAPIEAQEYTLYATIFVEQPVEFELTNMECDGEAWVLSGTQYGCTLIPKTGYDLPENIQVLVDGKEIDTYTYNNTIGTVTINQEDVTGPIRIIAAAKLLTYSIFFAHTDFTTGETDVIRKDGYVAEQTIDWQWLDDYVASVSDIEGYDYILRYDVPIDPNNPENTRPEKMLANNLWVYGSYEKKTYALTINYVYEDGTKVADTHKEAIEYGEPYSVVSPLYPNIERKGYMPDQLTVSGEMGAGDVTVTVTYKPSKNKLYISYQKKDGTEINRVEQTLETGATYSVETPQIEGYTPNIDKVEGTMNGDESEIFVVVYTPNTYTLNFNVGEGIYADALLDSNSKLVEYDNYYSYNAAESVYDGLPIPKLKGYDFEGWYFDTAHTQKLQATDIVKLLNNDTVVYANWTPADYKLTVRYQFVYTDGDFLPEGFNTAEEVQAYLDSVKHEQMVPYGSNYDVTLPSFVGYSAYRNFGLTDQEKLTVLTGTMPAQNRVVVISYEINTYEIKFCDKEGENVRYSDAETAITASDSFDAHWDTIYVKHNVAPAYSEELDMPNHETRAEYTYEFTGWKSSVDDSVYAGKSPNFPGATCDMSYYAMYDATENIVSIGSGTSAKYFTNVADAVVSAETDWVSTMTFRRNEGNGTTLDLTEDRVVLGNTYTGTSTYTLTIDLNGYTLLSNQGQPVIEHNNQYMPLVITDSSGNGTISASGVNDVVAIDSDSKDVTIDKAITINATSVDGNATAIRIGAHASAVYLQAAININASAPNGTATGIDVADSSYSVYVSPSTLTTVNATGKRAVGIQVNDATTYINNTRLGMNVSATEEAIGILISEEGTLINGFQVSERLIVTSEGAAYGVWNKGTISSLNMKFDVNATENAYGLYNDGGTITVGGISTYVDIVADSLTGNGYGLYNVANGNDIGTAETSLSTGAFAGSSYGIYSADNSIYAAGNYLYFKGADADSAMDGVVYTDYQETDATEQFAAGYYRLAMMRTIQFETNGGSEIATITQFYDTPLDDVETTRSGYTFVNWHETENLDSVYTLMKNMPDEDLTLYAEWKLNQYVYALDQTFKEVTVTFHRNRSSSDTTIYGPYELTEESNELNTPGDLTYASSSGYYLYIHSGWYTADGQYVPMYGDVSNFADENGELHLYAKYNKSSSSSTYMMYSTTSFKKIGTDPNPTSVSITSSYNGSDDMYYMYYVVQADGDYNFHIKNSGSYSVYYYVSTYEPQTTTGHSSIYYTLSSGSTTTRSYTGLKKGDAIAIAFRRYTSSTTYVSCYVTSTADLTQLEKKPCSEIETNYYNVEMGTVNLPVADNTGREGMRFTGWAEDVNADRIMQITPDMVDTVPEWQNGELWKLYSQWDDARWSSYTSDHRDFTDFTSTETVTIDEDETLSVRFETEMEVEDAITFKFKNGLPKDTILTLVDHSESVPKYYTYKVNADDCKEIVATQFAEMGNAGEKFDGKSQNMILQICYTNATADITADEVSLFMKGEITSEVDVAYSLNQKNVVATELDSVEVQYNESYDVTAEIPALEDAGYAETDNVFLRISWKGGTLAPGATFKVGDNTAKVYDGEFAVLSLGTVADFMTGKTLTLTCDLATMMQNEFANKEFTYEVGIAGTGTSESVVFGKNIDVIAKATQSVTITETPVLAVANRSTRRVAQGGTLNIGTISLEGSNEEQIEMYLFTMTEEGKLTYTDACATVFDSSLITITQDGKLDAVSGALVANEIFETTIQATATTGKYYLKIVYGDKYVIVPMVIVE